jgi:cell wall-associated NlpC family hydrolase
MRLEDFIGLPFRDHGRDRTGADCWGGVRMVLRELRGIELPDYGAGYAGTMDSDGISVAIRDGLVRDFVQVGDPQPFDLVIFRLAGKPWHVGLVVGPGQFLHWPQPDERGNDGTSRIARWTDRIWQRRVDGFWRYRGEVARAG